MKSIKKKEEETKPKLLLNLPLILRISEVLCSSKFNDQLGGTSFPADILLVGSEISLALFHD